MLRLIMIVGKMIIVVGLLSACSAEPSPAASTKQLTEADASRSIDLRAGDKLEVTLLGNPSTGFQWEAGSWDTSIIKLSGEPEFRPSSDALGAAGKTTLRFEAVAVGQTALKLIYHRPFEKDIPPAQTFEVTVTVK